MDPSVRHWKNPTYNAWSMARKRCRGYSALWRKHYVDKGITFTSEWDSFDQFLLDMGPRPDGHTLDRKDNTTGYSKENCRWATHREQMNNCSRNRHITYDGVSRTMAEWAAKLDINYATLKWRLQSGWSDQDALSSPVTRKTN